MQLVRNIDWLSFSVKLNSPLPDVISFDVPDGFRVLEFKGTAQFARRFMLFDRSGSKLLTFLCSPYSAILDERLCLVEVANPLLYDESWFDVVQFVFFKMLPCQFNNMHRLDLCCDWECTDELAKLVQDMCDLRVYVPGKKANVTFADLNFSQPLVSRDLRQISWGAPESHLRFKVYNKYKELAQRVDGRIVYDKPYIVQQWQAAGLRPQFVWRWEVSMHDLGCREFYGSPITLEELCNRNYWEDLQSQIYNRYFIVRENVGMKNKSRNPIRPFLVLPTTDGKKTYTKRPTEGRRSNYTAITALNRLMSDYVSIPIAMSECSDMYANLVVELVTKCRLNAYF